MHSSFRLGFSWTQAWLRLFSPPPSLGSCGWAIWMWESYVDSVTGPRSPFGGGRGDPRTGLGLSLQHRLAGAMAATVTAAPLSGLASPFHHTEMHYLNKFLFSTALMHTG